MLITLKKFLSRNIYPIFIKLFPLKSNKVVFSSFGGRNYEGNSRYISEYLHQVNPEIDIIWIFKNSTNTKEVPTYVKKVISDTLSSAFHLYTSKVWIDDSRKTIVFKKRKGQVYFQTWHGTPLKKIEFDARDKLPSRYLKYAENDSMSIDYLLSGNQYSSDIFISAFKVSKEQIWNIGTPRNDRLISRGEKNQGNILKKATVKLLFAPTFRNNKEENGKSQIEKLNPEKLIKYFNKNGQKLKIYVKFHPNVFKNLSQDSTIQDEITIVGESKSLDSLFQEVDILITDYSSIFFDFALLNKPIILFNYDEKEYLEERGLYLDLNKLPIPSAKTSAEIIEIIEVDAQKLVQGPTSLTDKIENFESGNATKKVVSEIIRIIERAE